MAAIGLAKSDQELSGIIGNSQEHHLVSLEIIRNYRE
jgi:hypothetical protein